MNSFENLLEERDAGKEDRRPHFFKDVQGDWRSHLDDLTHATFRSHAGAQLITLGYDD